MVVAWRSVCLDARVSHTGLHSHDGTNALYRIRSVIPASFDPFGRYREDPVPFLSPSRGLTLVIHRKIQAFFFQVLAVAHGADADAGQNALCTSWLAPIHPPASSYYSIDMRWITLEGSGTR